MSGYSGKEYYLRTSREYLERIRTLEQLKPILSAAQWRWAEQVLVDMAQEEDGETVYQMGRALGHMYGKVCWELKAAGFSYNAQASRLEVTSTTLRTGTRKYREAYAAGETMVWELLIEESVECV